MLTIIVCQLKMVDLNLKILLKWLIVVTLNKKMMGEVKFI